MTTIGVWTDLESHAGFWCGCFPSMQPIIRIIGFKLGFRSKLNSYNKNTSGHTGPNSHDVTASAAARSKNGYLRSGSGVDTDTDLQGSDSQKGIMNSPGEYEMGKYGQIRKE